jgi:hypothetical protein
MLAVGQSEISNIQFACVESMQFICLFQIINCKQLVPADALIFDCGELPEGAADAGVNFFQGWYMHPCWPNDLDEKPISWYMHASTFRKARQMVTLDANVQLVVVIWI